MNSENQMRTVDTVCKAVDWQDQRGVDFFIGAAERCDSESDCREFYDKIEERREFLINGSLAPWNVDNAKFALRLLAGDYQLNSEVVNNA